MMKKQLLKWCIRWDSNPRPLPSEGRRLTVNKGFFCNFTANFCETDKEQTPKRVQLNLNPLPHIYGVVS